MRAVVFLALAAGLLMSGCVSEVEPDLVEDEVDEPPQIIAWDGHVVHSAFDPLAHMKDPETLLFPVHQAGFLVEIAEEPTAIEVMVSWTAADAGFMLHPHYTAENDPALGGDTLYFGYPSEMFTESPGCIRIPSADMAAGSWPMMIHPAQGTMDVDYTISVGIQGATGVVPDTMHGHRSDGASPVDNHDVEPCTFLPQTIGA